MNPPSRQPGTRFSPSLVAVAVVATLLLAVVGVSILRGAGSSSALDSSYGRSMGSSVNGTGALAKLLRNQGHEVRTAWRLTDNLAGWADVIVRFAFVPGPPDEDEADWYQDWLDGRPRRALVYVVRDYDAGEDYWKLVLDQLGDPADAERRSQAETNLEKARGWVSRLPAKEVHLADPDLWFAVVQGRVLPGNAKAWTARGLRTLTWRPSA